MRCLACGAEMHLMHVAQDDTMPVPGYEHRTFMCSACGDIERRTSGTDRWQEDGGEQPAIRWPRYGRS